MWGGRSTSPWCVTSGSCSFLALPYLHPPHILPFSLATACVTFAVGYFTAALLVLLLLILGVWPGPGLGQLVCLPTLVSEVVCSDTHARSLPNILEFDFQNCALQVVLAGTGQRHFKSLQHNLAKLSGFSRRNCEFPTISKKSNCFSLWTSPWCFLLFQQ